MEKQEFPKFIQNKPTGKDFLEGKSAERVAKAIERHIEKVNDLNLLDPKVKLPQIIGLEGGWGSGKSNVIKILKTNVENSYYLFEYDAWGNQEDLQRRSFLEQLTQKLIDENILDGETEITKRGGGKESVTWEKKLKYLLARKTETISEKYPRISNGMAASAIVAILTPIFVFIAYATKQSVNSWWSILLSILISMIPVLASIIMWRFACRKDHRYKDIGYLLAIYNDKIENDVNYETISEDEPSVTEFKNWMNDISDFIELNQRKKLIVVFDNMDRLPSEKVKDLWSSIHTFFSEDGYKNIWVIIPFDKIHLANAFNDGKKVNDSEKKALTCQFIIKTFPIIYRVSAPVLTDRKDIFYKFFDEAFGTTQDDCKEEIQRIFSLIRINYTPRDIISFINELVSLKLTWINEIPLIPIAIFILRKEEILEDSVDDNILSKKYLGSIEKNVDDTEELQNYISALVYGIDVISAAQIALKQYLRNTLKGDEKVDINKYSGNKHFISILKEEAREVDYTFIDKAIISLSKLTNSNNNEIIKIWNDFNKIKLTTKIDKLEFADTHKYLLLYTDNENKINLVQYLCASYQEFNEFKGDLFYTIMQLFEKFISENKLDINIANFLTPKQVTPEVFIEYLNIAKADFLKYKIYSDNKIFDEYLARSVPATLPKMDFIKFLVKDDLYKFDVLNTTIENAITEDIVDINGFPEIINVYKLISKEKPLKIQFTQSQIQSLLTFITDKTTDTYYDLVAIGLTLSINTTLIEGLDEKIAERIEYYSSYGELLLLSVNWSSVLLDNVVKKLTEKSYGISKMSIVKVLPFYEQIKSKIGVDDTILLNRFNPWCKFAKESITVANIDSIIPQFDFYKNSATILNDLTNYINSVAIERMKNISIEELYANRNIGTYYWLNCATIFIQENVLKTLPDNLIDLSKMILADIAKDSTILPLNNFLEIIINKANKSKLLATIISLGEDFCNKTPIINTVQFIYFTTKFDFINKIKNKDGAITRNILNIVINDSECLNLILENSTEYAKIINKAESEAEDFKANIKKIMQTNESEQLNKFAFAIGISFEEEKKDKE
ncbi:MAG: NTPase [Bacteroidetes bacterium]|nr:NTPase [Bacteroidota bacterium]